MNYNFDMNIGNSIWIIIGLLVVGALLYIFLSPLMLRLSRAFKERAPLVKKYWKLVIPLLVLTTIAYVLVYKYIFSETNVALVGQISGLTLAVIVGYIAFAEFGESRFDKLYDSGMEEFRRHRFHSAQIRLEEAHSIKPKDLGLLSNLLELYIILGLYDKFNSKIAHYKRNIVEEREEVLLLYFITLKEIVQDHPKDAKAKVVDIINYVTNHPRSRNTLGWANSELKGSEAYKLLSAETKTLSDNVVAYITGKLSADDEQKFTDGDYSFK